MAFKNERNQRKGSFAFSAGGPFSIVWKKHFVILTYYIYHSKYMTNVTSDVIFDFI